MASRTPQKTKLKLRLAAAATPERVAIAAQLFADALRAVDDLPPDSVTFVVDNLSLKGELRAQSAAGKAAIEELIAFVRDPLKRCQRKPEAARIANAFTPHAAKLAEAGGRFYVRKNTKIAKLDGSFARVVASLAEASPDASQQIRGRTTAVTPVLRVGRANESQPTVTARIRVGSGFREITVADEVRAQFWAAAQHGREVVVVLDAGWRRTQSGAFQIDYDTTRAVAIDDTYDPLSGEELLMRVRELPPVSDEELRDMIRAIQSDE